MKTADEKKSIKLTIFRFNPEVDRGPRYETYETEWLPSINAHIALTHINLQSRANIGFRKGCREATCGTCTISVNGIPALACSVLLGDGDVLEPLKGYPVIRDLVIGRTSQTIDAFKKIKYGREGKPIGFVPAKAEDISISRELTICVDCHGCNSICPPMLETPERFIGPMYLVNLIRSMFNPMEDYDRASQAVDMGLYNCTMCGACTSSCPKNIDITEGLILARQRCVEKNVIPDEVKRIRSNILESDSLYGIDRAERAFWAKELKIPKSGETLFFASCHYTATQEGRNVLAIAVNLLRKVGIDVCYLGDEEYCCGAPLHFYGFQKEFEEKVRKTNNLLKAKEVGEIITPSGTCAYTFKELFPKYTNDFNIRVRTVMEVVLEKIKSGKISLKSIGSKKVVFHDPASLSRLLGMVKEPRECLRGIPNVNLVEPKYYFGVNTMSDGDMSVDKLVSSKIAEVRLQQLLAVNPDVIVTASATDLQRLRKAAQFIGETKVRIVDLIEFIGGYLGI
mgnify:CR=1 FL=1